MPWYAATRGNYLFLRIPLKTRICANAIKNICYGPDSGPCPSNCEKFKPSLSERFRLAWRILLWRKVDF